MTRSMTGYSRVVSSEMEGLSWVVELHSVNRKNLDIHVNLSRELLFLDIELRKILSQAIHRGQVTLKIGFKKKKESLVALPLLKKLKAQWEQTAQSLGFPKEEITLSFLLQQMDQISLEEFGNIQSELKKTLESALEALIKMKETEGKALVQDILKRVKTLEKHVDEMERLSEALPEKHREKLLKRLNDLLENIDQDERILKEVALFAEKADITEEITRLRSHFKQMGELFEKKEKSCGRTLEFLTQEILREINTIASKSGELAITQLAIASKAELEKIREQVSKYRVMEKLLGTLSRGFVVVISAPAGTGKTTMARMLMDEFQTVCESVSCTTRSKRLGEIDKKDYHFMSKKAFEEKKSAGEFLEYAEVFGHSYGTLKEHVEKKIDKGQHVLLVIDTQGAEQLKKQGYPAIFIFIKPPSLEELRTRLFNRKTEEEADIEERLAWAEHELTEALKYDYIITNDNLHHAYEILRSILISEEHKTKRYHDRSFDQ